MLEIIRSLLLSFFVIAVLLPVVRFALRRMLTPVAPTLSAEEVAYIQKKEWRLLVAYFFFASVLSVFSAGILALLASIIHSSSEGFLYLLTPNLRAFFAPGLLIGLTLALIPLKLVQETLLAHDYSMYRSYLQQSEGTASTKIYRILILIMLALAGAGTWFALQWHVLIGADQLQVSNVLSEDRVYNMEQIAKIEHLGKEGEYLITFSDNTSINTTYLKPVQLEMIALLSQKSGKRVIR